MKTQGLRFTAVLPIFAMGILAGCSTMTSVPEGAPLSQVEAEYGAASTVCPDTGGGQRMVWSTQPYGQYAWTTRVNTQGNIDRIVPALTDERFKQLATGRWTEDQVICQFGPPAEISSVGLPSSTQKVFSYRYRQSGAWNSLMHVYFDTYSGEVTRFHPGPDPVYERDRFGFFW